MAFNLNAFRKALRDAREGRDVGRDVLAAKIGVAKSTIQSWETGTKIPKITNVARIIEALDLSLSAFFRQFDSESGTDLQTSALRPRKPLAQDAGKAPEEGLADAASEIEHFTDRLAVAIVASVRRRLAESDRSPATSRGPRSKSGRRVHRRNV